MVLMSLSERGNYVTGKVSQTGRKSHSRLTEATTEKLGKNRTQRKKTCCGDKVEAQLVKQLQSEIKL